MIPKKQICLVLLLLLAANFNSPNSNSLGAQDDLPEGYKPPLSEPPRLEFKFEDNFSKDTRGNYEIGGKKDAVTWEKGKLNLDDGGILHCNLDAGYWVEMEFDLEFPELTENGQTSELKIWLDMEGANDSFVWFRQKREKDQTRSAVFIVAASGEWNLQSNQTLLSQPLVLPGSLPAGKWSIDYRQGFWSCIGPIQEARSFGFLENNGSMNVKQAVLEASGRRQLVKSTRFETSSRTQYDTSPQFTARLGNIRKLYQKAKLLSLAGRGEKALPVIQTVNALAKETFGAYSSDYATGLNDLANLYQSAGEYTQAEPLYLEAKRIREKVVGKENPYYAVTLNDLGTLYQLKAEYARAEPLYLEAKRIRENAFGKEHSSYAASLNNLATLYQSMGKYSQSEPLHEESLAIREKTLGKKDSKYAESLNNLAAMYLQMEEYSKAESLCLEANAILAEAVGKKHPLYVQSLGNLAMLYRAMGEYSKAKLFHEEILAIIEKQIGKEHWYYGYCLNGLAGLYQAMGDYSRAEPLHKDALAILEKAVGKEHRDYANSLNDLARLYESTGEYPRAKALFLEGREIVEKVLGKEHPEYSSSLNKLAGVHESMGEYPQAEILYLEARAIREKKPGKGHPDYANSLHDLAVLYQSMGEYSKAEPLHEEARAIREKTLGKEHPDYANSLNSLAGLHYAMEEYPQAETLYLGTREIVEKTLGKEHPHYADTLSNLATLYRSMGKYSQAEKLFLEARAIDKKLGNEHPRYADSLNNLATLYQAMGESSRARPLHEEALAIREKTLGKEHPRYADSLNDLAMLYHSTREAPKAEPLYLEAKAIAEKALGKRHPYYADSLNNLAMLYRSMGEYLKAEPLIGTSLQITRDNFDRYSTIQSESQQRKFAKSFEYRFSVFVSNSLNLENRGSSVWKQAVQWKGISLVRQKRNLVLSNLPETQESFNELKTIQSQLSKHLQGNPTSPGWQKRKDLLAEREETATKKLAQTIRGLKLDLPDQSTIEVRLPRGSCVIDFRRFIYETPNREKPGRFLAEPHYLALIRKPDSSVEMLDLGSAENIESAITRWRSPIEKANSNRRAIDLVGQKAMDEAGQELRKLLWEPLVKHIADSELVIVSPDGALGRLPLIALPGKKPGTYLLEEKKIVYLPVPALLPQMLSKPARSIGNSSPALLVGGIKYGDSAEKSTPDLLTYRNSQILQKLQFGPLQNSGKEINGIQSLFQNAETLTDGEATEKAFQEQLKEKQVLHIATHGFFQSPDRFMKNLRQDDQKSFTAFQEQARVLTENPYLLSGLALANANNASSKQIDEGDNDGILYSAEIAMMPMGHVELAVLSACETSLGTDDNPGEGLIGIQRSFQVAGVKSTIASYWKVDDTATRKLMNRFYENLIELGKQAKKSGQDPNSTTVRIDALIEAQRWMLRDLNEQQIAQLNPRGIDDKTPVEDIQLKKSTDPKSTKKEFISHPRYWAAFVLSGDWR